MLWGENTPDRVSQGRLVLISDKTDKERFITPIWEENSKRLDVLHLDMGYCGSIMEPDLVEELFGELASTCVA